MSVIFIILITVCYGVVLGSSERVDRKIKVTKIGSIYKVAYSRPLQTLVRVTILDETGNRVFSEKVISRGSFTRPYNLSLLPKGNYKICVSDDLGEYTKILRHGSGDWVAHIAKLNSEGNKYLIAIPKQDQDEVSIEIYDNKSELLFSESQTADIDFAKIFDLQSLSGVTIKVVNITTGQEKYFRTN